ncbi:MAG: hypothetical protein A3F84_22290 [Candidatus Handelsmanbacteria bacterium RIFCSPLOWO2_12_FULL_64_10]|uniref:ArnT-like N-terminal domain-containing protein n=1 Tax=Handelsmanbacteria sp. (strain RIFCSPLOWO2_12_FULL_64_10) TaxID=1817868 RepID=A0A1F6CCG3_HANXR|nr:MAG: hypothetical protein A3F84_22290 [Candidatus Handelsmanbacteria bacterium RIFCSPLOWO2_12_FULL_64_10]
MGRQGRFRRAAARWPRGQSKPGPYRLGLLRRPPIQAGLLAAVFTILAGGYSLATPIFEGPDETGHFPYVTQLAVGEGLPVQGREAGLSTITAHPPFYYALAALAVAGVDRTSPALPQPNPSFVWSGRGLDPNAVIHTSSEAFPFQGSVLAVHLARLVSVFFGALTIAGTYWFAATLSRDRGLALGTASVVAFNPQFLFISGVVSNDSAVTALVTLSLGAMAVLLRDGPTPARSALAGALVGLALITKAGALVLLPLAVLVLAALGAQAGSWRKVGEVAGWAGVPCLLISGWWFARNQALYGDPLGYQVYLTIHPAFSGADFTQRDQWARFFEIMHRSFWGWFGWMTVSLERQVYAVLRVIYAVAAAGGVIATIRWARASAPLASLTTPWLLTIAPTFLVFAWTVNYVRTFGDFGLQGRYWFPAIAPLALLLAAGLPSFYPGRWRLVPLGIAVLALASLAVAVPFRYLAPAYNLTFGLG